MWVLYFSGSLLVESLGNKYFLEPRHSEEFRVFVLSVNWVLPCLAMVIGTMLLLLTKLPRFYYVKVFLVLPALSWLLFLNGTIFINPVRDWKQWLILGPLFVLSFVVLMGTVKRIRVFKD